MELIDFIEFPVFSEVFERILRHDPPPHSLSIALIVKFLISNLSMAFFAILVKLCRFRACNIIVDIFHVQLVLKVEITF